jgi:hypothetical protein
MFARNPLELPPFPLEANARTASAVAAAEQDHTNRDEAAKRKAAQLEDEAQRNDKHEVHPNKPPLQPAISPMMLALTITFPPYSPEKRGPAHSKRLGQDSSDRFQRCSRVL